MLLSRLEEYFDSELSQSVYPSLVPRLVTRAWIDDHFDLILEEIRFLNNHAQQHALLFMFCCSAIDISTNTHIRSYLTVIPRVESLGVSISTANCPQTNTTINRDSHDSATRTISYHYEVNALRAIKSFCRSGQQQPRYRRTASF